MTSTLPQHSNVLSNTSLIVSLTLTSHTSPWQFWCHPDILASSVGTFLLPTAVTRSPRVSATRQIERPRWPVAPNTFFVQQNALSFLFPRWPDVRATRPVSAGSRPTAVRRRLGGMCGVGRAEELQRQEGSPQGCFHSRRAPLVVVSMWGGGRDCICGD